MMYYFLSFLAISLASTAEAVVVATVPACCTNTVPASTVTLPVTVYEKVILVLNNVLTTIRTVPAIVTVTTGTPS